MNDIFADMPIQKSNVTINKLPIKIFINCQSIKYLCPEEDDEYYDMSYDGQKTRWDNTTYPHCCSSDVDRNLTIYDKNLQN